MKLASYKISWVRPGAKPLGSIQFDVYSEEEEIEVRKTLGGMRLGLETEGYTVTTTKTITNEEPV